MSKYGRKITKLLCSIRNGDKNAWEKLFDQAFTHLKTVAYRYLVDKNDLEDDVIAVCEIVEELQLYIQEEWLKKMVKGILKGESDIALIMKLPCERTLYYNKKKEFVETVYRCCIAKRMVSYEELLIEGIA